MIGLSRGMPLITAVPTPTPMPTATVTQTVLIPTSVPVPTLTVPATPGSVDASVLMDGFWGALLAAILGGCVAVGVARFLLANEKELRAADRQREQDRDAEDHARMTQDRRTNLVFQLLDVIEAVYQAMAASDRPSVASSVTRLLGWASRIEGLYGHVEEHQAFAFWFKEEVTAFAGKVRPINNKNYPRPTALREALAPFIADLIVIEKSTLKWIAVEPGDWAPVLDERTGQ